jgi:hypothetical protein
MALTLFVGMYIQNGVKPVLGVFRDFLMAVIAVEYDGFSQRVDHDAAISAFSHVVFDFGTQAFVQLAIDILGQNAQRLAATLTVF